MTRIRNVLIRLTNSEADEVARVLRREAKKFADAAEATPAREVELSTHAELLDRVASEMERDIRLREGRNNARDAVSH